LADRTGHVWIGTTEGLDVLEGSRIRVDDAWTAATQDVATGTLFEDDRGQVWASSFQGLAYARDGVFTFADSVPGGHIQAIAEDAAHNVWVSHQEHGLLRLRDNRVVQVIPWDRFGGKVARVIAADPLDGGVWLGFYEGGVSYFKNGAVRSAYVSIDGAPIGTVTSLYLDQHQTLWAATQRGLLRLDGKTLTLVTTREGLPCNVVHWATQDPSGTMWVDTACGLARFPTPPHASSSSDAAAMEPMVFDASDGTPSRAAVGGYGPKVTTGPDGRVWFANNDGVGVIDPNHLALNRVMPPVHIERIVADHTTYDTAHDLELASSVRDIRIDYSALSLVDPDRVRFRYKLEGRDRDWIDAGNRRQAFYTDLPPGNYRFRVIAANNNGLWNMEGDSQALSILPAFYQLTSFRIACGILLVALAWSLHHARLRRITERLNVRFDDRLTERTRIAQDLHDTLLQDFLSVSMQLHVIADQLDGHRSKARFDVLLSRLRDIVETGRRTVQGLQTGDRDHRELADALVKDAESLRGHQSVEICVTIEGDRRPLSSIVSDDVYCIGREAIANVFRHAGATRLSLFLNYTSGSFQLKVVDDGRGMEADVLERSLEGHWGIYGMRQRAERGGGRVRIWTRPKAGTEVELTVPAQIAYTPADSNAKRDGAARG
jgi:signal transduction histidine kinase